MLRGYLSERHTRRSRPRPSLVSSTIPRTTKPENLRSEAGYITDSLLPDVKLPYRTAVVPRTRAVSGVLPVRSFLSPYVGPLKFYPRLLRYCEREKLELSGPVMEIYDGARKRIEYIAPVK